MSARVLILPFKRSYLLYSAGRVEAVKQEKAKRSAFKSELNTDKRKVVKELEKVDRIK